MSPKPLSRQKRDQLFAAMDHINRSYGKNGLFYGCTQAELHHPPMHLRALRFQEYQILRVKL